MKYINQEEISTADENVLASMLSEIILKHFEDPENMRRYKEWEKEWDKEQEELKKRAIGG